jgi:SAM-dependent methyltransferase
MSKPVLAFTGERFTPECVREIAYEHWHRYAWASQLVKDKVVLDAACGEGYGSALLAESATSVIGVDVDADTIEHARQRYGRDGLRFVCSDCLQLPLDDDSVDVVVSLETLEHLADHDGLMAEFRRVLKADGLLVLSSPDRQQYSEATGYDNPFHAKELNREEFEALLSRHFAHWCLLAQTLGFVSLLWPLNGAGQGGVQTLQRQDDGAIRAAEQPQVAANYFLAVASAEPAVMSVLPSLSVFDDQAGSIYQHYNHEVGQHIRAGQLLAERDAELAELKAKLNKPWWRWWW